MNKRDVINKQRLIGLCYCIIVLFLPVELIANTSFYSVTTPSTIRYNYRYFDFSFIVIPLVLYAFVIRRQSKAIPFIRIILAIGIKDIIIYTFGLNNRAISFDFSLYFVLLIAWSISVFVLKGKQPNEKNTGERFLDLYFTVAFFTVIFRLILQMNTSGRYGAIGLSVGGTGFLSAVYIIYCLYVHDYCRNIILKLSMAFLLLLLSGQRTNMFICFLLCIPFVISNIRSKNNTKNSQKKALFLWCLLLFSVFLVCVFLFLDGIGVHIHGLEFINRMFDAVSDLLVDNLGNEQSLEGRFASIEAGKAIIEDNVFGITNVFYDLQYRMNELEYPTFPHSTLLDCALLWSTPITIFCEMWILKLMYRLARFRNGMFWVVLYIQVLIVIWGGPFMEYPMLFIILLLLSMANNTSKKEQ